MKLISLFVTVYNKRGFFIVRCSHMVHKDISMEVVNSSPLGGSLRKLFLMPKVYLIKEMPLKNFPLKN